MRLFLMPFVLLTLVAQQSAPLAGKITSDPNAPGARVEASAPEKDERLVQKVTYEAGRKTVLAILTDLSQTTGVTLRAGYNSKDWQVRDRKMNIFAKDLPLRDLMDSIARVMKFKWSKYETDGAVGYRLCTDRKSLLGAERQRYTEEERLRKRLIEGRCRFLSGLEAAASMSDSDLEKLREQSPYIYQMTKGWGKALPPVFADAPSARQAFLSGEAFAVDFGSMSADAQRVLADVVGIKSPTDGSIRISGLRIPGAHTAAPAISVSADRVVADSTFAHAGMGAVIIELKDGERSCALHTSIADPESDSAKLHVRLSDALKRADKSEIDRLLEDMEKVRESETADLGEPATEHPDDPALLAKVKMRVTGHELADALSALAKSSDFAIVSDSFGRQARGLSFSQDETTVRAVLDELASRCRYNWERHRSTLELHDRDWFAKRAAQIPEAWIEVWRQAFKKNGTLDIAELAHIAALTPEQINLNIVGDEVLSSTPASDRPLATLIMFQQDVLRAYGALTEAERKALFSPSRLDIGAVAPDRRAVVEKPIARRNAAFLLNSDAQITLSAKKVQRGKQFDYTLTATTSDSLDPIAWTFTTPKYEPPKEAKPADDAVAK